MGLADTKVFVSPSLSSLSILSVLSARYYVIVVNMHWCASPALYCIGCGLNSLKGKDSAVSVKSYDNIGEEKSGTNDRVYHAPQARKRAF